MTDKYININHAKSWDFTSPLCISSVQSIILYPFRFLIPLLFRICMPYQLEDASLF